MEAITAITNNINIRNKMILSYLFVVFLPVLTVGLLLTNSLREQSVNHAVQQSMNNVDKIRTQVEEVLKIPYGVSNTIYFDSQLQAIAGKRYESDLEVYYAYREYTNFTNFLELYKEIGGIRFYSDNETLLDNWSIFKINDELRSAPWFHQTLNNSARIGWHYLEDTTKGGARFYSLVGQVFNKNMTLSGVLVITVDPRKLQSIMSQEPFETMIVTDREQVIAAKDSSLIGSSLEQLEMKDSLGIHSAEAENTVYQGQPVKIIAHAIRLENSDDMLRIVSIIPLDTILKEAERISYIAYAITGGSLVLSTLLILYFSGALSKRINILSKDIRKVAMGDFTRRSIVKGMDEVGQLSRHFNFMVGSIEDLISQVQEGQWRQHELQLKHNEMKFRMLANQVNPHFLFNVLEAVRMSAHCQDQHEIANTVKALGNLLRHSLEIGQSPIPLAQEIELIRMYLDIQHFRFGDKLAYRLPDPEDAEDIMILPMLLQPIVENAIVHGIEYKMGKGLLQVSIIREPQGVRIEVKDNGIGMDASRIQDIRATLDAPDEESDLRIGLRNVHHRSKLHYGEDFGLYLASDPGIGTTISIKLPYQGGVSHAQV